jgi:hypothetical protein
MARISDCNEENLALQTVLKEVLFDKYTYKVVVESRINNQGLLVESEHNQ